MIKFNVMNRWTGDVAFTAEIDCAEDAPTRVKLGLAAKWAYQGGADLSDADLRGADLSDADLSGADLRGADLSGADLSGADLRGADLSGAVLRDADLSGADLRGADLRDADLRGADLSGADLSGAVLIDADLSDAVLSDADLSDADLRGADLSDADLRGAVLRGADLSDAVLSGVPVVKNLDSAILAAIETPGNALEMKDWHTCETTHCRAGWAIHLAGAGGAALEFALGPAAAGALIYAASKPGKKIPSFYAGNAEALEDIRRGAAEEQAEAQNA